MGELELIAGTDRALRASKSDTLGTFSCKCLPSPLADEIALNLGGKSKCKSEYLARDVVSQPEIVLDDPDMTALVHADIENLHYHEEIAPESGNFRADDEVAASYTTEQPSEQPFVVRFGSADSLLYPAVDDKSLGPAEFDDFKPLILNGLFVAAHPDVSIIHNSPSSFIPIVGRIMMHSISHKDNNRKYTKYNAKQMPLQR